MPSPEPSNSNTPPTEETLAQKAARLVYTPQYHVPDEESVPEDRLRFLLDLVRRLESLSSRSRLTCSQ